MRIFSMESILQEVLLFALQALIQRQEILLSQSRGRQHFAIVIYTIEHARIPQLPDGGNAVLRIKRRIPKALILQFIHPFISQPEQFAVNFCDFAPCMAGRSRDILIFAKRFILKQQPADHLRYIAAPC